ncbi:MAG: phenylalanine-4-hydroxylase [Bacteroidetes bacterium]|nr:phenylalanine-4-hydroxylase [Bacteroidota bacterium]
MKQQFEKYTDEDLLVWRTLFDRQIHNLQDKSCKEYLIAIQQMEEILNPNNLPNFVKINNWFETTTKWEIKCVPGLIPVDEFFSLLSKKKFCSSTWLRSLKQLDYLEEPDMFHDIFGHIPLLSQPIFSDFMHEFGKLGAIYSSNEQLLIQLQRLYWFTIEFGLIQQNGLKIYGAGIASSFGESNSSLSVGPQRINFDLEQILNTPFKNDEVQNAYFVIESFEELFDSIVLLTKKWKNHELAIN